MRSVLVRTAAGTVALRFKKPATAAKLVVVDDGKPENFLVAGFCRSVPQYLSAELSFMR